MTKGLERDLGLPSVLAISIGAMIGSGIFILPALAVDIAGPAVVLAYVIAGLLVVPAALSKSEMATAMPESGGTYLFIERGMGPLLGTIAGIGTWFALSFKGALALVGGVPYLLYLFEVPPWITTPLALTLATVLVAVNVLGAKQTGQLQVVIVGVMLVALGWFAVGGLPSVSLTNYEGFFASGTGGILEATGLVFVSYAGVTKVASVAEEIENPGRNVPLGILGSLAFTTVPLRPDRLRVARRHRPQYTRRHQRADGARRRRRARTDRRARGRGRGAARAREHRQRGRALVVALSARDESGRPRAAVAGRDQRAVQHPEQLDHGHGGRPPPPHRVRADPGHRQTRERVPDPRLRAGEHRTRRVPARLDALRTHLPLAALPLDTGRQASSVAWSS